MIYMQATQSKKPLVLWVDEYLRQRFIYTDENIETLVSPEYMLIGLEMNNRLYGDCDDITMLNAALLTCLDIKTRLVAIRSTFNDPNFDHVFLEAMHNGDWVPFDITVTLGTEIESFARLTMGV
jgi:transglutaminase-like putative cysteine protease